MDTNAEKQSREFARQAREGERLRVAVRRLTNDPHAALIHHSGEDCDVVRVIDLIQALDPQNFEGAGYRCAHCGDVITRPSLEEANAAGKWHDKNAHGHE